MGTFTTFLNLFKPGPTDTSDPRADVSSNMDLIDAEAARMAAHAHTGMYVEAVADARVFVAAPTGVAATDTAAVNTARAAAGVGGTVQFRAGVYVVSGVAASVANQTWIIPAATTIRMSATNATDVINVTANGVKLLGFGLVERTVTDAEDVIAVTNASDVEIAHLRVRNSTQVSSTSPTTGSAFGIRVTGSGCRRVSVHHCTVSNSWLGIGVLDVSTTSAHETSVCDNFIFDIGNNGIGVNSIGTQIAVSRNIIDNFGTTTAATAFVAAGIEIRGNSYGICSDNLIENGNYGVEINDGIRVEYDVDTPGGSQLRGVAVTGNSIRTVSGFGIRYQWNKDNVIANNVISATGAAGIHIFGDTTYGGPKDTVVASNELLDCARGISLQGIAGGLVTAILVTGNYIRGGDRGLYLIDRVEDCVLANNVVVATTGPGIDVASALCNRNTFTGCRAINCGTAGGTYGAIVAGTRNRLVSCEAYETGAATHLYSLRITGIDTYVEGGYYGAGTTGTIQDAGTNTVVIGVVATAGNPARSTSAVVLGPLSQVQRGFGAKLTVKASSAGTEAAYFERFSAAQTANVVAFSDQDGNPHVFVGPDMSFNVASAIKHTGSAVGFNGATAVGKRTLGAAATDAATTQTLANNLRQALIDLGLGQT